LFDSCIDAGGGARVGGRCIDPVASILSMRGLR
jgi:hypothetical protein